MFTGMKKHNSLIVPILFILSSAAYAAGYLDRLRGIDQSVLCVVVWFAPAIVVVLFALGGFLYSTGNLTNRTLGKSYMLNSLAGLFLAVAFIGLAFALVPSLKIDPCLGEAPAEKKCTDKSGWSCGCPAGKECEAGSALSDATDCASSTCCKCVDKAVPGETCQSKNYVCGDCPTGKTCVESTAPGCEAGKRCCDCQDEETCQSKGYLCGCTAPQICKEEDASLIGCKASGKNCCKKCEAPPLPPVPCGGPCCQPPLGCSQDKCEVGCSQSLGGKCYYRHENSIIGTVVGYCQDCSTINGDCGKYLSNTDGDSCKENFCGVQGGCEWTGGKCVPKTT